jgi:hypothetical protein
MTRAQHTILAAAIALCACTGGEPAQNESQSPATEEAAAPSATRAQRIPGTPEGGLGQWVSDIRAGLADLPRRATEDAEAAGKLTVDLYVNRQEWLERYWGTYGLLTQDVAPELGRAVMDAEARFHELMILMTGAEAPAEEKVAAALAALNTQLDQVLARASEANVPLDPPAAEPR